jgi:hypothetical protein
MRVERQTVDLSAYPDLVVIYLGMRMRRARGLATLIGIGPQIRKSWQARPDGLLLHEDLASGRNATPLSSGSGRTPGQNSCRSCNSTAK